jgi:HSP20 family molecular chaperone IbpA
MWNDALSMLEQAERLHRQFFRNSALQAGCWEPPVDVVETADEIIVYVALPGVPPSAVTVTVDMASIVIAGVRRLPVSPAAHIHRVEIPYGRFERRIALPMHALQPAPIDLKDGCLVLTLKKTKEVS